jgi:O-antigen ligase
MLLTVLLIFAIFKSRKIGLISFIIFILAVLLIPKVQDRITGALALDETSKARIMSWENAADIFLDNKFLGVGFNNYRQAQVKYGFFEVANPQGGHSGAGSDSTILTIAATTGILGLLTFMLSYLRLIFLSFRRRKQHELALINFIGLVSLLVHSQFVNSLLYPAIMAWVWILNGFLFRKNDA